MIRLATACVATLFLTSSSCCSKKDDPILPPIELESGSTVGEEAVVPLEEASAPTEPDEVSPGAVATTLPPRADAGAPVIKDGGAGSVPSVPTGFPTDLIPSSLPPMPTLIPSAFPFPQPVSK